MQKRLRGISPQRPPGLQRLLRGPQFRTTAGVSERGAQSRRLQAGGLPPVPQPAEQRGRRQGPALRPLLTGQDVGGRTAPVSPSGGGARPAWYSGPPGTAHCTLSVRGWPVGSGALLPQQPADRHRPSLSPRLSFPPFAGRPGTLRPPLSVAATSSTPVGCPFSWTPGCRGGHSPPAPPFLGLRCPARRASRFKGCPPDQAGDVQGTHSRATNTTN